MIRSPTDPIDRSILIRVVTRLLVATYLIEAGILLALAPWTLVWRRNAFLGTIPGLVSVMGNPFMRGAVTGIGIVTFFAGMLDLFSIFFRGRREMPARPAGDDRQL